MLKMGVQLITILLIGISSLNNHAYPLAGIMQIIVRLEMLIPVMPGIAMEVGGMQLFRILMGETIIHGIMEPIICRIMELILHGASTGIMSKVEEMVGKEMVATMTRDSPSRGR